MDKLIDAFDLPKLNQKYINHLNRTSIGNKIEAAIKNRPSKKSPGHNRFIIELYKILKEKLKPVHLKLFMIKLVSLQRCKDGSKYINQLM
jgi:hypothetical protein